jgi:N-carbamoylputrescine amidase
MIVLMRMALGVHRVAADPAANLATLNAMALEAAANGAELVVFSEASLTGFIGTGDPSHDRRLAETIPGPSTQQLCATARRAGIGIALGLYEKDEAQRLYDSAVLVTQDGHISLHYRRISPQWHRFGDDPGVYREGLDLPVALTQFARTCILLCGDLFDDVIMKRAAALKPDLVLVPFAREFDSDVRDADAWHAVELGVYAQRAALTGATTALVNQIGPGEDRHFGGALLVSPTGSVLSHLDLYTEGLLYGDCPLRTDGTTP